MYNTKNALAELAVRLGTDVLSLGRDKYPEIEKASRIVAELANADLAYANDPVSNNCVELRLDAFKKCRAIAEEMEVRDGE